MEEFIQKDPRIKTQDKIIDLLFTDKIEINKANEMLEMLWGNYKLGK